MGAISDPSSLPILNEFLTDPARCVRETCEIAISKIQWDNSEQGQKHHNHPPNKGGDRSSTSYVQSRILSPPPTKKNSPLTCHRKFTSVDPAPPSSSLLRGPSSNLDDSSPESINSLQTQLINTSLPLFERYRAMFALRNIGTDPAVDALASGFADDSELFKCVTTRAKNKRSSHLDIYIYLIRIDTKLPLCLVNFSLHTPSLRFLKSFRTLWNLIWSGTKLLKH